MIQDPSNPYAAPQATVADPSAKAQGRPGWVWAITIYFGIGFVGQIVTWTMIAMNSLPMDEPTRAYYEGLSAFDYGVAAIVLGVQLVGIVLLFLMRTKTIPFLALGLGLAILNVVYKAGMKGFGALLLAGPAAIGMVVGFLIWGVIIWYALRLQRAGRLR